MFFSRVMADKIGKKTIYLDTSPWSFQGNKNVPVHKDLKDDKSDKYFNHIYKYGKQSGNITIPDGYVIVWGANEAMFNGIYHSQGTADNDIYNGPYTKRIKDQTKYNNHYLKFSRYKGIKIVPNVSKYCEYPMRNFMFMRSNDTWNQSPKNDDKIANLRWDLIQNTKQRLLNKENIKIKPSIKGKAIKIEWPRASNNVDKSSSNDIDIFQFDYDDTSADTLQKYYHKLFEIKSFQYKYIYVSDGISNKLIHHKNKLHVAKSVFIRNFAFNKHLYPELATVIPNNYKRKTYINDILLILFEHFNQIESLGYLVFDYLNIIDKCIHENISHIICQTEGKNAYYYTTKYICDKCETSVSIPYYSNINEQLSFISRVKRSFGVERNGRKSGNTRHLHSFKIRKWLHDQRFNGMTHQNIGDKVINIYNTDDISKLNDSNKIGTVLMNETVYRFWETGISVSCNMSAIRTKSGIVGYCLLTKDSPLKELKVTYDEILNFIKEHNIIISTVRVRNNENPISRIKYTLRGLYI